MPDDHDGSGIKIKRIILIIIRQNRNQERTTLRPKCGREKTNYLV
jgi:hypothetical protein